MKQNALVTGVLMKKLYCAIGSSYNIAILNNDVELSCGYYANVKGPEL